MKSTIAYVIIIIALILYLFFGHNGLLKYHELVRIKNSYQVQLKQMDRKINELQRELKMIKKDKEYLEMLIKKELNMSRPGEDIYILEDNSDNATE